VEYRLPFGDVAFYEEAVSDLFEKHPPSPSVVSVTIREGGKRGSAYKVHHAWPPGSWSAADLAEFIAHKIGMRIQLTPGRHLTA
jgi:hypothetical protein